MSKKIISLILVINVSLWFLSGCSDKNSELTPNEINQIKLEIKKTIDKYAVDAMEQDVSKILSFWSNSDDFIHAGDGEIFGDYKKWESFVNDITPQIDKWLFWRYFNFNTIVLGRNTAACTVEFEYAYMMDEEKNELKGSWTYVFRKNGNKWQVITDNGTHVPVNE